jgi:hypothetical protein
VKSMPLATGSMTTCKKFSCSQKVDSISQT